MSLQSLGLGVEITLQDKFTPVAMRVTASFGEMKNAILQGAGQVAQAGNLMGRSMGMTSSSMGNSIGKKGGKGKGGGITGGLGAIQSTIGGVTTAMMALEGVAGGFHAFDALTSAAGKFDKQIASAGAIMRASKSDMMVLEKAAIAAGIATQFSPTAAAEGLELLGQSGYNATEATKLLIPVLDLAAGGQISVAQAAATSSAAVKIFGLSIDQAKEATDKLLTISNATSLTANDLQISLGNVSRGAIATGQSIDEILPSIGLVKGAGVDASVAASSVSSALLMLAKNAKKFKGDLGVEVTDAAGNFRPFMDVVLEADQALAKKFPNAASRAGKAMELFGKFGLTAYTNMSGQLRNGITGADGLKHFGADAIESLRKSMANASAGKGAAAEFRERLLDTFEGQQTLLKGSMETLFIAIGQPLTKALRPVVEATIKVVNKLIDVVQGMPEGVKTFAAKFAIGAAALGSFALAALGVAAGIGAVAGPIMEVVGALSVLGPIALVLGGVFGVVAAGALALKYAIDNNLGGLGDSVTAKINWIKLAFQGLAQVFTNGEISGPLADELSKAENEGILNFVGRVYESFNEIKQFFDNFILGITTTFDGSAGAFKEFGDAIDGLLGNFKGLTGEINSNEMDGGLSKASASGMHFGKTLGEIAVLLVRVMTKGIEFADGMIANWNALSSAVSPVVAVFSDVGTEMSQLINEFNAYSSVNGEAGSSVKTFGGYLISVASGALGIMAGAISQVRALVVGFGNIFGGIGEMIHGAVTGNWSEAFHGFKRVVYGDIVAVTGFVLGFVRILAGVADTIVAVLGLSDTIGIKFADKIGDLQKSIQSGSKEALGLDKPVEIITAKRQGNGGYETGGTSNAPEDQFATVAAAEVGAAQNAAMVGAIDGLNQSVRLQSQSKQRDPIIVKVNIDGREVGQAAADASSNQADGSYMDNTPLP